MNISYEKSKLLKDNIHALNKNRFTTKPIKSIIPIKSAHPLQMVSELCIRVRVVRVVVRVIELELKLKNLPTKKLN